MTPALPSGTLHPSSWGPLASLRPASHTLDLSSPPGTCIPLPAPHRRPEPGSFWFAPAVPMRPRCPAGWRALVRNHRADAAPLPPWRAAWPEFPARWRRTSLSSRGDCSPRPSESHSNSLQGFPEWPPSCPAQPQRTGETGKALIGASSRLPAPWTVSRT